MAVDRYNTKPDLYKTLKDLDRRLKSVERRSVSSVASTATTFMQAEAPWPDEGPGGDHAPAVGALWINPDDNNALNRWTDQGAWALAQDRGIQQALDSVAEVASDGLPPTTSPDPICLAGIGIFIVRWTPIANHDTVTYEVHVSSTLGFTATPGDPTTLVGTVTAGSQFTVKRLAGALPAEGAPDPYLLDYDTTYYVRIIATDVDGAAAQSLQAVATVFRVTGIDIQADSITAANILAGTLTGELFAATVILAGTFKTAEAGQRVETGFMGIKGYKADGSIMVSIPTSDGEEMVLDGEFVARKLTVTGEVSFQTGGTVEAGGVMVLARGAIAPSATPTIDVSYVTTYPDTTSLTVGQKSGALGVFDLVPSEVSCIEWKDSTTDYWVIHQVRSNGTRAWFFRVDNGDPFLVGGVYFNDYTNWAYYSVWEIPAGGTHPGVYRMGRWIPSGTANTYYLSSPAGLNRYSRQNGVASPVIGSDGDDIFVAEIVNTDDLRVRYFVPTGTGENLASPFSTTESTTGYSASHGLCTMLYHPTGFDIGSGRYATAERGWNTVARMLTVSAGLFYPGGSGNNWASANKEAESWESPTSNRRGFAWDAANGVFWTYGGDGYMYKHTTERWDPAVSSSTYWAKQTFYDQNTTGGTHETAPGDAKWYVAKRRASNTFTPPALPGSPGVDDPDRVRLYMARGSTAPANSAYHLQAEVTGATTFQTLATATANPPTSGNFPASTPAKWINDDSSLIIDGSGDITAVDGVFTTLTKGSIAVAVEGPYYYAWVSSAAAAANGVTTTITGYTLLAASSITVSTGVFTLPRAGRYRLYGQLYWASQATPVGTRISQWQHNSTTVASATVMAQDTALGGSFSVGTGTTIVAALNDTVLFKFNQTAGGSAGPLVTTRDLSFIVIEYIGA